MANATAFLIYDSDTFTSPIIKGWLNVLHNGLIAILLWLSYRIQKGVSKALKRLGPRSINFILEPTMVINDLTFPFLMFAFFVRSFYYPMNQLFGDEFCHIFNFVQTWIGMTLQFHSFTVITFRYICLFHDGVLTRCDISPKKLAKVIMTFQIVLATLMTFFIINGSVPLNTLNTCLGQFDLNVGKKLNNLCSEGSWLSQLLCKISVLLYLPMSSNIPEGLLLYPCFKKIQEQTEAIKPILAENTYARRRRDNGIVLSISIRQWAFELFNSIIFMVYTTTVIGYSSTMDKFYTLYNCALGIIVGPAFYLHGDVEFRVKLDNEGYFSALKSVLFDNDN